MLFNIRGWARFQAFAGIVPNSQAETHGALLCLDEASKKRLDQAEMFYKEGFVQVKTYSGKIFKNVSVYLTPHEVN